MKFKTIPDPLDDLPTAGTVGDAPEPPGRNQMCGFRFPNCKVNTYLLSFSRAMSDREGSKNIFPTVMS